MNPLQTGHQLLSLWKVSPFRGRSAKKKKSNSDKDCISLEDDGSNELNALPTAPRVVEFIAELRNITVCEGEDAVFKCVVSPEDTHLAWRLNGKQVARKERAVISSNGLCHMLCIHNCMVSDSGRVTADAEGLLSEAELQVQGELWRHPSAL